MSGAGVVAAAGGRSVPAKRGAGGGWPWLGPRVCWRERSGAAGGSLRWQPSCSGEKEGFGFTGFLGRGQDCLKMNAFFSASVFTYSSILWRPSDRHFPWNLRWALVPRRGTE